jgi:hypothetical protein
MEDGLWAAIVTGVVAITAGYLGTIWGSRNEHRQWLRNEKMKVYNKITHLLNAEDDKNTNGPDFSGEIEARRSVVLDEVLLLGSDEVYGLASKVGEFAKEASVAGIDVDQWESLMEKRDYTFLAMIDAMRRELRLGKGNRVSPLPMAKQRN